MMDSRSRGRRWRVPAALLACGALALAACGDDDESGSAGGGGSDGAEQGPIEFGYLNALTGDFAVAGKPEREGIELAVEHINEAGGVCERQLTLAGVEDDQGQANLSVAGLRKLAQQENLDLIIGPGITPPGLATGPVAERLGVWFMLETAQREPWEGTKYVFSNISPQDTYAPLIANYLDQQMEDGASEVAILYANVPYGQAGNELLKQEAEKMGWDVVVNEAFDPAQFQFRSQAQKVAQADPDGMMIWGAATPADAQILKQVRNSGYDGPASGDVAFTLPFIPEIAGAAAETIVMPSQLNFVDPDEKTQKFLDSYEQTYESPPTFLPAAAYDAVHILAEAIKKADCNADAESVAEAMNSGLEYTGVSGQFSYNEEYKGGPVAEAFRPMTFKDGEYAEPENVEDVD